jgi:hypothetical protein
VIERLGHVLRTAADVLAPPPPVPSPQVAVTIRRSGRKYFEGVEWLPESFDDQPITPPMEDAVLGAYDTVNLRHDVLGYDRDGKEVLMSQTFHVTFREVRA